MKVLRLFAPLWLLLALSLWVHWQSWQTKPMLFAAIAGLPLLAAGAAGLVRDKWRLELTPDAMIHHAIGRSEVFLWARMGPLQLKAAHIAELLFVRTFWFAFPIDAPQTLSERSSQLIGRRILCVFGDHSARETIQRIEDWRALYAKR
jgi:hypothetical protein